MSSAPNLSPHLLDIETLVQRPTVRVDGVPYELLSANELSVLDAQRFSLWASELDRLQAAGEEDDPQMQELVDRIARKALVDVPHEVFAKLSGVQRLAVVEVFTALLLRSRMAVAGATARAMGTEAAVPTGASLFPGFSGSSADRPASGWKKRLCHWFGLA